MEYGLYVEGDSFGKAWKKLNHEAFTGEPEHVSSNAHYFNCMMKITNPHIEDVNLGYIGYTKSKFTNLINLYWLEENAQEFIARLHYYKNIKPKGKDYVVSLALNFDTRMNRTGACLQYLSIGQSPEQGWVVFVRTRANEIAQRLYADMVFVHLILKKICAEVDIPFEKLTIYWTIDAVYQSVIGCNLWLAMTYGESVIKGFMDRPVEQMTKWQKRVRDRYLKNFNLDKEDRKVYNYAVQQRATYNFDRILEDEIEMVDMQELYDKLPGLDLNQEVYDDLFGRKGGGR